MILCFSINHFSDLRNKMNRCHYACHPVDPSSSSISGIFDVLRMANKADVANELSRFARRRKAAAT